MELESVPLGFSDWLPHEKKVVLKVTLVRHGETVANRDRIVQGQTPGMLTEFGREQARRLGKRLAKQRWDAFYCSDLTRTQQTAQELLIGAGADVTSIMAGAGADVTSITAAPGLPVEDRETAESKDRDDSKKNFPKMVSLELLRERSAGELEGTLTGSVDAAAKASGVPSRSFRPKNGESWEDVQARADRFLRWLVDSHLQTVPPHSSNNLPVKNLPTPGSTDARSQVDLSEVLNPATKGPVDGTAVASKPAEDCTIGQGAIDKAYRLGPEASTALPVEADPPRRMLRSGSSTGDLLEAKLRASNVAWRAETAPLKQTQRPITQFEKPRGIKRVQSSEMFASGGGGRGRMLRSGSFTGDPRAASKILGIPRSESFGEGMESEAPRVAGVKRAGSFNALAPKVMKRVDSLGLSKLFNDEMHVDEPAGGGPSVAQEGGESPGPRSDDGVDEMEVGGPTNGHVGASKEREYGEFASVWSDSDCGDGEMQVFELGLGDEKSQRKTEKVDKRSEAEEGRPLEDDRGEKTGAAGPKGEDKGTRFEVGGSDRDKDIEKGWGPDRKHVTAGLSDGGGGMQSGSGAEATNKERPKAKRKGGRPAVKRVLVVTHGGFIKEFVNASMAYAEGPSLSKTRSQTRHNLGWRTLASPVGLVGAKSFNGVNRPPGGVSLTGPVQIQRTFGHNDFVSFRAVDENGRFENLAANGQAAFPETRKPSSNEISAETKKPTRLRFDQLAAAPSSENGSVRRSDGGGGVSKRNAATAGFAASGSVNGNKFGDELAPAVSVYPGRPRNTSVYEFEIKRLEGRKGTPRFTVKMIRENDVYHLDGLIATRTFHTPGAGQKAEEKVVWQSPSAKLLD